ncbi:hypothetical protein B9Z65_8207 [Elsinoe australis]|uniref:Uncharacterized protein n=1 Tax=Elsinoe australis TaxID=40998 RepID=A0A2P7ZMJ6_9PEZI|nr:hypothetical protein B9Z65_8207 [Elsinoe australis]
MVLLAYPGLVRVYPVKGSNNKAVATNPKPSTSAGRPSTSSLQTNSASNASQTAGRGSTGSQGSSSSSASNANATPSLQVPPMARLKKAISSASLRRRAA